MSNAYDVIIPAGSYLIIETGEYSDRYWNGPVRVLKDIIRHNVAQEFREKFVRASWQDEDATPESWQFLPWLVSAGYVEVLDNVADWYIGSDGVFEP